MLTDSSRVRVSGPLSAFAAGFADELARQGYRPRAACNQMRLLGHLSRWLVGESLGADDLHTTAIVEPNAGFLQAKSFGVGHTADRDQHDIGFQRLGIAAETARERVVEAIRAQVEVERRTESVGDDERLTQVESRLRAEAAPRRRHLLRPRRLSAVWPNPSPVRSGHRRSMSH